MSNNILNEKFIKACANKDLVLVKKYLTSSETKNEIDIHYKEDLALIRSCFDGNLELIKYLLTSPELKKHSDINAQDGSPLLQACKEDNYDVVEYLLTSTKLKKHADIHVQNDYALNLACTRGCTKIVKFLLEDSRLKENIDFFKHIEEVYNIFNKVDTRDQADYYYHGDSFEIIKYLVCEYGLERNKNKKFDNVLEKLIKLEPGMLEVYQSRKKSWNLQNKLQKNLSKTVSEKNKPKI